ncbi:MAG: mevalonate kinase, partial [Candidatus Heimdallarchaeota archaeon]|nr:mevalonate kinase [Candidatus Heimdallarchaeota archaeon]
LKKISKVAFEAEKITHGRPSGIDNSIATFGGYIRFENGFIEQKQMTSNLPILIVDTKIPRNTKKLVEGVAKLKDLYPEIINPILSTMGNVADLIHQNLEIFDLSTLGDLFKINQGLLDAIGVGHPKLSNLMNIATEFGAVGTKLTGAGGGGCFLVLGKDQIQINEIASELKNFNVDVFVTKISSRGVIIE